MFDLIYNFIMGFFFDGTTLPTAVVDFGSTALTVIICAFVLWLCILPIKFFINLIWR